MRTDTRTPDEIEREIERERAELASTVGAIQEKFSPDAVVREIVRGFRDHGGEFGTAVTRSIKQNPLALALTGVGLAWLVFGRSNDGSDDHARQPDAREFDSRPRTTQGYGGTGLPRHAGDRPVGSNGYEPARGRSVYRSDGQAEHRSRYATYPSWARHDLDDYDLDDDERDRDDESGIAQQASETASSAAAGARNAASSVATGVKSAGSSAVDGVGSAANSVASGVQSAGSALASGARSAARGTSERAARARERLARGTENLSEAARDRVIAARARAVDMAQRADAAARRNYARGRDATKDLVEQQPLVAGALAMAVGAALAGALPRTRHEDELLGETRDDLFDEAERIFHEERQKAERVARAAVDEVGKIAEERRAEADSAAPGQKTAVEAAADEVRDAAGRVSDAAKEKARKEKLGNPGS